LVPSKKTPKKPLKGPSPRIPSGRSRRPKYTVAVVVPKSVCSKFRLSPAICCVDGLKTRLALGSSPATDSELAWTM
jgi:hypothetical protein